MKLDFSLSIGTCKTPKQNLNFTSFSSRSFKKGLNEILIVELILIIFVLGLSLAGQHFSSLYKYFFASFFKLHILTSATSCLLDSSLVRRATKTVKIKRFISTDYFLTPCPHVVGIYLSSNGKLILRSIKLA